jgi:hypothetical protein
MQDIIEGMPSYSTHLAEENKHVGECLGCRLRVEGHGQGLGLLGVKEAILKGLLIGQSLDVIPGHVHPVVDSPQGPPHVPCLKGNKLKASHGKLEDLVSRYVPSWLPDGTAELLDDVLSEVSEYIQGGNNLVIVEGCCHSLAEEKDSLEHVHCVLMDSCLDKSQFPLRVSCIFSVVVIIVIIIDSQFVGVYAPLMSRLATGFQGFILIARHQHLLPGLRAGSCLSCHCKVSSQVKVEQRKSSVGWSCNWLLQVNGRAIGHCGSMLPVAQ